MLRGRYAPSPTGCLHLGNARTALVAYLAAKARGGHFIMRVEDLDRARTVPAAVQGNLEELRWLGLDWDEGPDVGGSYAPYIQSERLEHYQNALEQLQPHLFTCYLSRKDVRSIASAPHPNGNNPHVYGLLERQHNRQVQAEKIAQGKAPALRFRVDPRVVQVDDAIAGRHAIAVHERIGDFVLRRADGLFAYHLAVVVDDIAMQVNQVVRGGDLLEASAAQALLYEALGAARPSYAHVPLLLDDDGERMAKRKGSLTLTALRQAGVPPERIVGWLAWTLGLLPDVQPVQPSELLANFSLERIHKTPHRFSQYDRQHLGIL